MNTSQVAEEMGLRQDVVWAAKAMWQKGYVIGTAGNISARIGISPKLLITPSGAPYDSMVPEDIVLCNIHGENLEKKKKPSSEILVHTAIYQARPEVAAIVHTHSTYATSLAVSHTEIPFCLDELYYSIGVNRIPVTVYARSGTTELASNVVIALGEQCKAVLMANHGAIAVGANVKEAFEIAEEIEKAAMIFTLARLTGGAIPIDKYFQEEG